MGALKGTPNFEKFPCKSNSDAEASGTAYPNSRRHRDLSGGLATDSAVHERFDVSYRIGFRV